MKKIGIITINFNTEDLLDKFIGCLIKQHYKNWVLVIVNNSPDNAAINQVIKKYNDKRIILIGENKNVGYSKGNNYGFSYLVSNKIIRPEDIILFSNEDIVIEDRDFLSKALDAIDELGCGFLGPKIINTDGSLMNPHIRKTGYLKCLLHMGNNGRVDRFFKINRSIVNRKDPLKVFLLNGACFFCVAGDFEKAGLFDTNTFIYYEEELIFRKVNSLGIDVYYYPDIIALHEHSASVKKSFSNLNKKRFVYNGEIYFLTRILKVNRFLLWLFKLERKIEMSLVRLMSRKG